MKSHLKSIGLAALAGIASLFASGHAQAATVAYYGLCYPGNPEAEIIAAGHTPLALSTAPNATNLAAYEGISTNPPNHFGRYDSWNAPAPSNLMPATASFSQSNTFPWLAISK